MGKDKGKNPNAKRNQNPCNGRGTPSTFRPCTKASLATWIRETCLSEKRTRQSQVVEVNPDLLRQLAGIGNNLNQIARIVNQKAKTDTPLDRVAVITALAGIERELKRIHNDNKIS